MANFSISLSRVPNIPNEFSDLRPKNIVLRDYSNLAPIGFCLVNMTGREFDGRTNVL